MGSKHWPSRSWRRSWRQAKPNSVSVTTQHPPSIVAGNKESQESWMAKPSHSCGLLATATLVSSRGMATGASPPAASSCRSSSPRTTRTSRGASMPIATLLPEMRLIVSTTLSPMTSCSPSFLLKTNMSASLKWSNFSVLTKWYKSRASTDLSRGGNTVIFTCLNQTRKKPGFLQFICLQIPENCNFSHLAESAPCSPGVSKREDCRIVRIPLRFRPRRVSPCALTRLVLGNLLFARDYWEFIHPREPGRTQSSCWESLLVRGGSIGPSFVCTHFGCKHVWRHRRCRFGAKHCS